MLSRSILFVALAFVSATSRVEAQADRPLVEVRVMAADGVPYSLLVERRAGVDHPLCSPSCSLRIEPRAYRLTIVPARGRRLVPADPIPIERPGQLFVSVDRRRGKGDGEVSR